MPVKMKTLKKYANTIHILCPENGVGLGPSQ